MLRTVYLFILIAFVVALLRFGRDAYRKADKLPRSIAKLEWVCAFAVFFDVVFRLTHNVWLASFYKGMFYLGVDVLGIFMVQFVLHYTQLYKYNKYVKMLLHTMIFADLVSYIVNIFTPILFSLGKGGKDINYDFLIQMNPVFLYTHLGLFNLWMLLGIGLLVYKTKHVSRFYHMRYTIVAITIGVYDVFNIIGLRWQSDIDLSLIAACLAALVIHYFSLVYIPNGLIGRILIHANQSMKNIMIFFDITGHCVYINDTGRKFFGLRPFQNLDVVEREFMGWCSGENFADLEDGGWDEEREIDGEKHFLKGSFEKLYDENGICIAGFVMLEDRTEEHKKYEEQRYRATHDLLTGLYNRVRFSDRVTELLLEQQGTEYLMVCTDIKDFKLVNDLFGFETGDEVLRTQAEILKSYDFQLCAYSRLTSDKFALCIPKEMFKEEDFLTCMRVMNEKFNNDIFQLHVNIGVYEIQDITEAPSIMCDKAALAISYTRGNFDQRVCYYNKEIMDKTIQDRKMVAEFEDAIKNEEFVLFLQPQFDTDQRILGCEALVRWQHPKLGLIFPGSFIEVFERAGLIYRLDAFVWELAVRKLAEWKENPNNDLYISVNISVKDFYFIDVYKKFVELVEKYQVHPSRLKLEITETAIMTEFAKNQDIIRKLREYGFTIEIDDFGSGYSSLNMLRKIYADVLKIDMGFLGRDDVDQERSNIILQAIISMSRDLKMPSITEGVETKEQFEMLKEMGCGVFQGYFFEKPIPIPMFEEKYVKSAVG